MKISPEQLTAIKALARKKRRAYTSLIREGIADMTGVDDPIFPLHARRRADHETIDR
jgi:hypothetical protein